MPFPLPRPVPIRALAFGLATGACALGGLAPVAASASAATTISGVVWTDVNADGVRQAGEPGAAGVRVAVERQTRRHGKAAFVPVASRTASATGAWSLGIHRRATYRVTVIRPAGFTGFARRQAGAADRSGVSATGVARLRSMRPGGKGVRIDAGLVPAPAAAGTPAPTSGPASPAMGGSELPTPTTPSAQQTETAGPTPAPSPSNDPAPVETPVEITTPFQIAGIGWKDSDADGIRDAGEPRLQGLVVRAYKADGKTELGATSTNAFGGWALTIPPGTPYRVKITNNDSTTRGVTRRHQGQNSALDSDISRGAADAYFTDVFPAGTPDSHLDAGFGATTTLGNRVWQDKDHDGIQDAGEPGVGGVTLELFDGARQQLLATTTSDGSGMYHLGGAFFGGAPLRIHVKLPVGATYSPYDQGGDDGLDSDVISNSYLGYLNGWTAAFAPSVIETVYEHWDVGLY